jgi:hypothetical protein
MTAVVTDEKRAKMMAAIRGLLAKTEASGATVEEASAAAEKAQALAFKYSIDLAAVAATEEAPTLLRVGARMVEFKYADRWFKDLMAAIAAANFCKMVYFSGSAAVAKRVEVVGAAHNIEVCEHLHAYLTREILRLGNASYSAEGKACVAHRSTWVNRFAAGAVVVLRGRLAEANRRMAEADTATMALVVNLSGAVSAFYADRYPKLGSTRQTRAGGDGYAEGKRAARDINLSPAVGGSAPARAALRG